MFRANLPSKISLFFLCITSLLTGCASASKHVALNDTSKVVSDASNQVARSSTAIKNECKSIIDVAPEPVQKIMLETTRLDEASLRLETAKVEIDASTKDIVAKDKLIAKQTDTIKNLENERYGLISRWLAALAILSLVFSVASIFVLASPRLAVAGGVLFSVSVAAQWLLAYAVVIGIATLVALAGGVVYIVVKERRATTDVVKTVEAIKTNSFNFKDIANTIQSVGTRRIVDRIKDKLKS